MDPTTIMAIACSLAVFAGWLVLPHSPKTVKPAVVVREERQPVAVSA